MSRKIYYNPNLKINARKLRNNPTFAEKSLWAALKGKQLHGYDFNRQKPIGEFIYDFYCYRLRLVIEVDGISHNEKETQENDKLKESFIKNIGFNVLRFTDDEVLGNPNMVIRRIERYIDEFEGR